MKQSRMLSSRTTLVRLVALASTLLAVIWAPTPASAQLSRIGASVPTLQLGGTWRGVDTAYDPGRDVYLVVTAYGPVYGVFVNSSNERVSEVFAIDDGNTGFGHQPVAKYSPDVSNGAGGFGGFIVVWLNGAVGNSVRGRIVSLPAPGRVVTSIQTISDSSQGSAFFENRPAVAYSRSSGRFLVAWTTISPVFGLQGRFVSTTSVPQGSVIRFEEGGSRDPGLAWNPATKEFGMVNTAWNGSGAFAAFRRISPDGLVSGRDSFGFAPNTFATGIDVNAANQYVLAWAMGPGTMSALFESTGLQSGTNFVSARLGYDLSLGLAFNPNNNTFLVASQDSASAEIAAAELYASGVPKSAAEIVTAGARAPKHGSFYPQVATRTGTNQWNVVYSFDREGAANQVVASGGATGTPPPSSPPPPPPSGGCTTPDPFSSIGGGTCINGGWVPGGAAPAPAPTPAPPAPPAPPSGGCTTPDPFVSIGGGTCIDGGWRPGTPPSAPAPPTTPAPAPAPAPAPPSTCSTPDPFVSIGGGTCRNGGWVPGRDPLAVPNTCSTPDPFTSLGGGICENGGWRPRTILCLGSDPFVSIGGGVCIGTGWVPRGAGAP